MPSKAPLPDPTVLPPIWASPRLSRPTIHLVAGLACLLLDAVTGPLLRFPILFVLPVGSAAWFGHRRTALVLAAGLPALRAWWEVGFETPHPAFYSLANAGIRILVLSLIAYLMTRTADQARRLEQRVKVLEGLLPICMFCKRIRATPEDWQQIEAYISKNSDARFSHGLCPECEQKHFPDDSPEHRPPPTAP